MNHERALYPFQADGSRFLADRRYAYLADGMGMGKSVQFADAARQVNPARALMICPASAIENWHREWESWGPRCDLDVVSYNKAIRMRPSRYPLVGIDEAHYCKTRTAQRTKAALSFAKMAERAWLLSGTPMPNHPGELYAPVYALWPGILRKLGLHGYEAWFNHFCLWTMTDYGPRVYGTKNQNDLKPFLKRIMLRRSLKDVGFQLPPLRVHVSLLPKTAAFERALREFGDNPEALKAQMQRESEDDGSVSRLRRLLGEYKAPFIADMLAEELEGHQYEKIVVMAHHRSVLDVFRTKLAPFGVVGFDGTNTQPKGATRQQAIDMFTTGAPRVFVAQQSAAGVAINLQVATEIALVEPDWSPDVNAQVIKRIHRIGTKDPCRARYFGVAGTLDEAVLRTEAGKVENQVNFGLAA